MAALTSIPKATKTTKSHQSPFVSCRTLISKKLKSYSATGICFSRLGQPQLLTHVPVTMSS